MTCENCCVSCDKYSSVKEMKAKCKTRKERARATRRTIYNAKKNTIPKQD